MLIVSKLIGEFMKKRKILSVLLLSIMMFAGLHFENEDKSISTNIPISNAMGTFDVIKEYKSYQGKKVYYEGIKYVNNVPYRLRGYLRLNEIHINRFVYYGIGYDDLTVTRIYKGGNNIPMPYSDNTTVIE